MKGRILPCFDWSGYPDSVVKTVDSSTDGAIRSVNKINLAARFCSLSTLYKDSLSQLLQMTLA